MEKLINEKNKIKVALIGFGYWGVNFARLIHQNSDCILAAIIDKNETALKKASIAYAYTYISNDFNDIFQIKDLSCVIIATPVKTHFPIVKMCLKNNLHVLCEKVLSDDIREIEKLITLSEEKNLILDVDYTFLENSVVNEIKKLLNENYLGQVNYLTFKRTGLGPIRNDVNVIFDLLAHDISILIYWVGMPEWVTAVERCIFNNKTSDIAFLQMGFQNGIIANFQASWLSPLKQRAIEVVGERGMIIFDDTHTQDKLKIIQTHTDYQSMVEDFASFQLSVKSGDIIIPNISYPEPLKNKLNRFVHSILKNDMEYKDSMINFIRLNSFVLKNISTSTNKNSRKVYL